MITMMIMYLDSYLDWSSAFQGDFLKVDAWLNATLVYMNSAAPCWIPSPYSPVQFIQNQDPGWFFLQRWCETWAVMQLQLCVPASCSSFNLKVLLQNDRTVERNGQLMWLCDANPWNVQPGSPGFLCAVALQVAFGTATLAAREPGIDSSTLARRPASWRVRRFDDEIHGNSMGTWKSSTWKKLKELEEYWKTFWIRFNCGVSMNFGLCQHLPCEDTWSCRLHPGLVASGSYIFVVQLGPMLGWRSMTGPAFAV